MVIVENLTLSILPIEKKKILELSEEVSEFKTNSKTKAAIGKETPPPKKTRLKELLKVQ